MSCVGIGCGHEECRGDQLEEAREDVIRAAKIWYNGRRSVDGIGVDSELFYAVRSLQELEQPTDPVREFVRATRALADGNMRMTWEINSWREYEASLEAAEKALGMEEK
jgi:hypothetical protein